MPKGIYQHKSLSEETKKKMSKIRKGKSISWGNKIRISKLKSGYKHSEETKKKISLSLKMENHPNWQGGISFEPYPLDWTDDLKESIRKRDDYICQICETHQDELERRLACHHIDYNKENLDPENLISLCIKCHIKTNCKRNYWFKYFKDLILIKI